MNLSFDFTDRQSMAIDRLVDDQTKFVLFGGASGGGKSWVIACWLIGMCLAFHQTRWFIGREELKRLRESTLITFFKVVKFYKIPSGEFIYNGQDHFIRFTNGSQIDLLDLKFLPSDPLYERYGSIEYTGGAIDEGGEVYFGAFDVLKTRIGRYNNDKHGILGKILITANPKKNWLYKTFYLPEKNGTLPDEYAFIRALATDNPYLDSGYISNLDNITDKVTKERLKYGNWEYDDDVNSLIPYDNLLNLFTNSFVPAGEGFISADIARFGKDTTTIGLWKGWRLEKVFVLKKSSITDTAKEIRNLASVNAIPMSRVVVDDDGVGGGVVDILACKGFVNNSKPVEVSGKNCNYSNLKSQCGFMFSELANSGKVFIQAGEKDKERIIEELEQLKDASVDTDGKKSLLSKDKVKDLIGRSPDYSDMIIMRMFHELPNASRIRGWGYN